MRTKYTVIQILLFLFFALVGRVEAITVTQTTDLTSLGNALGDGVNVTGISGNSLQFGTFTNASGLWGIGDGIVLSSGDVNDYNDGPNTSDSFSTPFGGSGQADLDGLIPGFFTEDAATIEFTFTAVSDQVKFDFVFGSEEYDEFVGSDYNDVFGAFLGGPGGTNVSYDQFNNIISVNSAWFYGGNPPDNSTGTELDGATVLLSTVFNVTQGEEYNFMFGIADAGDDVWDSTVYITEFTGTTGQDPGTNPVVPVPSAVLLLGSGLIGLAGFRKKFKNK